MIDETSESDDEDDDNYGSIEKEKKKPVQEKTCAWTGRRISNSNKNINFNEVLN